jgi:hypothetical protein
MLVASEAVKFSNLFSSVMEFEAVIVDRGNAFGTRINADACWSYCELSAKSLNPYSSAVVHFFCPCPMHFVDPGCHLNSSYLAL